MRGSGSAREARRRPELDLLVGMLEAAGATDESADPQHELIRLEDPPEPPIWREDG